MGMRDYVTYFEKIKTHHQLDKVVWIGYVCSSDKGCDFLELMASHQGFQPTIIDCAYFSNLHHFQNENLDGEHIRQYSIQTMTAYIHDRVNQKILNDDPVPMIIMNNYSHLSKEQQTLFINVMKEQQKENNPFYLALLSDEDFDYSFSSSFAELPQYIDYYDVQESPILEKIEAQRQASLPYQKQCELEMHLIEQLKHQVLIKIEPTLQAQMYLQQQNPEPVVKKGWSILKKWL
jgi:hypothetical protein